MIKLFFNGNLITECSSVPELSSVLSYIYCCFKPPNPVVLITHLNGNMLEVGISSTGCFANFQPASLDPPYYSSIGDQVERSGFVTYQMSEQGHLTEIPLRNTISFDQLLDVVTEFHQTGELPLTAILWEMD